MAGNAEAVDERRQHRRVDERLGQTRESLRRRRAQRGNLFSRRVRKKRANEQRIGTNVGVDGQEPGRLLATPPETDLQSVGLAVAVERHRSRIQQADATVARRVVADQRLGAIGRATVDHEDLRHLVALGDQAVQAGPESGDLVENRDEDGDALGRVRAAFRVAAPGGRRRSQSAARSLAPPGPPGRCAKSRRVSSSPVAPEPARADRARGITGSDAGATQAARDARHENREGPVSVGHRIVVIGSGFGGLAAAVRLAARGHEVTLVEKRDQPGGRAYVYRQDGFTFDGGPTVITAPWLITELFELAGREPGGLRDARPGRSLLPHLLPRRRHVSTTAATPGGWSATIRAFSPYPGDAEGYRDFVAQDGAHLRQGLHRTGDQTVPAVRLDMVKIVPDLVRLESYRTVYGFVSRFVKDDRLRQVLSFHPLLVGGNPFQTTSIYTLIHHLEREWGVWFAMGGTGAIVAALVRLFEELGGTLMLGRGGRRRS